MSSVPASASRLAGLVVDDILDAVVAFDDTGEPSTGPAIAH
jgi:hypothetical protein